VFSPRRRARGPSLFPYTTLFRSEALCEAGVAQVPDGRRADEQLPGGGQGALVCARPALVEGPVEQLREPLRRERLRADDLEPQGDRKSTRLNSSHVKISYAVFCL